MKDLRSTELDKSQEPIEKPKKKEDGGKLVSCGRWTRDKVVTILPSEGCSVIHRVVESSSDTADNHRPGKLRSESILV